MSMKDRFRHWAFPKISFVEDNLIDIREIVDAARELQGFPTRENDRATLRNSAARLDRALRMFMQASQARKGADTVARFDLVSKRLNIAKEIITHLEILKRFVEEFRGDEGRMSRMKKKAEREFVGNAIRQVSKNRFSESTTFKQFFNQNK